MQTNEAQCWGLYGGAGFIGQHLAHSILHRTPRDRVVLLDIQEPAEVAWNAPLTPFLGSDRLQLVQCDVRDERRVFSTASRFDVIVNLAAVHREPGHRSAEYFETNVAGAQNVALLAEKTNCREIVFTSSISVYGVHGATVNEGTVPQPRTPYGQSKWQAEQIHTEWARRSGSRLTIIRPGVVFGPGEQGNVSRLVRESLQRNRPIRIQPDLPKAGIYIGELVNMVHWLRAQPMTPGEVQRVNGVSRELLTFNAYGEALQRIGRVGSKPLVIPGRIMRAAVAATRPLGLLMSPAAKFHPDRLAKLTQANAITSTELERLGYPWTWTVDRALEDWLRQGL